MGEDEMNAKEKKELALTEIILIVLAVIGVLAMIWFAWLKPSREDNVNTYKECAAAGNPVQDSYPSVCVTKGGKRFVNPDESLN
jgi:flagellar basal body-associated protein FliL